ncbi:MAG: hypothetical protein KDK33_12625 [Leptospiraceae bacterium]|nr:hypothetical protein [Leptospiraceae bacterium]
MGIWRKANRLALGTMFGTLFSCLQLDPGVQDRENLAQAVNLLTALNGGSQYYIFMSNKLNDGQARSFLKYSNGALSRIDYSGGPDNIWKARVLDGTIFALDNSTNDTVWITKDEGTTWTQVDVPGLTTDVFLHMEVCGSRLYLAKSLLATDPSAYTPGYYTDASGSSYSEWRASGVSLESIPGDLACGNDRLYASLDMTPFLSFAPAAAPESSTSATSNTAPREFSAMAARSGTLLGIHYGDPFYGAGYSSDAGANVVATGNFDAGYTFLSSTESEGALTASDAGYHVGLVYQTTATCKFYRFSTGAESPAATASNTVDCGPYTDVELTSMAASGSTVAAAYRANGGSSTGILISSDGGLSFEKLDVSSVWSDQGYITSIQPIR